MDQHNLQDVPVFPLPRTVLMPGALLPLHVFEPRYRALVQHCLAESILMGIATLRPDYEREYYASPPIWPELGIGRVVAHQGLSDGRYNIVVRYEGRATVIEEASVDELFRVFHCERVPELDAPTVADVRSLRSMVMHLGGASTDVDREVSKLLDMEGDALLHGLARLVLVSSDAQRGYLASVSTRNRVRQVEERLAEVIASRMPSAGDA